jgi:predicted enzyme related to lactoylglutathione lyase
MAKLDHLGLQVADRERAAAWNLGMLGLEIEFDILDARVTAVRGEADFTIFMKESPDAIAESTLYFQVDSVDAFHRRLADRGVTFAHAPRKNPWGYGAELLDPDGHCVRLWDERSMKEPKSSDGP